MTRTGGAGPVATLAYAQPTGQKAASHRERLGLIGPSVIHRSDG